MAELYPAPNLDVARMVADLNSQQAMVFRPGSYDDQQARLTGYRTSYGNAPAMFMSGMQSAGNMMMGAAEGAGSMFAAVGSMIKPIGYDPPARVYTGYYGQYEQETGLLRSMAATAGVGRIPRGVNAYQYGYHSAVDLGERAAGAAVAVGSVGLGIAGGSAVAPIGSLLGGIMGAPFGPVGMSVGATIGGLAGSIGGYMGADAIGDRVVQQRELSGYLEKSSFRYVGAGSSMADPRLGGGMSLGARREVTDYMRQMDIKDPSMGMEDLSNILRGSTNLGLFAGTQDMEDFKKKFKNIVEGVKTISKTLNTTLEEGLQFIKDFKAIGVDASQMGSIAFQASAIGKVAGRTGQEVVGLGLQGAELFRGTGVEMNIGYQASVMNQAAIRSARDAGLISQEAIAQAGGEEAMAQRMTAGGMQFVQSAVGRGFGASFYNPSAGPAGFDAAAFKRAAMEGGGDAFQRAYKGAQNLSSPQAIAGYTINQDKFASEMGKTFGGKGLQIGELRAAADMANVYKEIGVVPDYLSGLKYALIKDMGKSPREADDMMKLMENASREFSDKMKAIEVTRVQNTIDEAYRTSGLHYRFDVFKDKVSEAVEPTVRAGATVADSIVRGVANYWERDVKGIIRYDLSGSDYKSYADKPAEMPFPYAPREQRMRRAAPVDLSVGGGFWNPTMGEQIKDSIVGLRQQGLIKTKDAADPGDVIIGRTSKGQVETIPNADLNRIYEERKIMLTPEARLEELRKQKGGLANIGTTDITALLEKGLGLEDIILKTFGPVAGPLTEAQWGALWDVGTRNKEFGGILAKETGYTRSLGGHAGDVTVATIVEQQTQLKALGKEVGGQMGLKEMWDEWTEPKPLKFGWGDLMTTPLSKIGDRVSSGDVGTLLWRSVSDIPKMVGGMGIGAWKGHGPKAVPIEIMSKLNRVGELSKSTDPAKIAESIKLRETALQEAKDQGLDLTTVQVDDYIKNKDNKYGYIASKYAGLSTDEMVTKAIEGGGALLERANLHLKTLPDIKADEREEILGKLQKIYTGDDLAARAAALQKLDITSTIRGIPGQGEMLEIAKKKIAKEGGAAGANDAVILNMNLQDASKTGAAAPGIRSGAPAEAGGIDQGSAAELTQQQVNINYEILMALRSLYEGKK
jgi:hypothetical protein